MSKSVEKIDYLGDLDYDDFRQLALDQSLSPHQKIGFPDTYRAGQLDKLLSDICGKLPALEASGSTVLDIGCGCSDLPRSMINRAIEKQQSLLLVDSAEMLNLLPDAPPRVEKIIAKYPDCADLLDRLHGSVDAILVYSVMQYVFRDGNIFDFLDKTLALLAPSGHMLVGDIPNTSMRRRFFSSDAGIRHHQKYTNSQEIPNVDAGVVEHGKMDDTIVMALVGRARAAGFHGYVMPQAPQLAMATRREDVLIVRP